MVVVGMIDHIHMVRQRRHPFRLDEAHLVPVGAEVELAVDGAEAADLYQTYGVPPEVFETMAAENNLAFDWDGYRDTVAIFTRMLDNVVEINGLPLQQQRQEIMAKRRHGKCREG